MIKKSALVTLALFLMPALANAGLIIPNVATGAASGSISPAGSVYATTAKTYTITAGTGYTLDRVTNNAGTVPGTQISGSGPWTYTVPLSASTQTVYVYFKVGTPANPPQLVANAPASLTVTVNTPQTISGGTSTILNLQPGTMAKFKWTSTPAAVFNPISSSVTNPANIVTQFTAPAVGNFTATLTLTAPGATPSSTDIAITVPVPGVDASNVCLSCHAGWPEATAYGGSLHAASLQGPSCQTCHNPTGTASHPFAAAVAVASCTGCHLDTTGNVPLHPVPIGTNICVSCHNPHSTIATSLGTGQSAHYNNITTAMYPASYVTSRAICSDCHFSDPANAANRHDWATSGHADINGLPWIQEDFKTKDVCVRCHTTTGFIAYSTGRVTAAWGTASDKTKELLTCVGCHSNIEFGIVRKITPVRPYPNDTYVNREMGESNVCVSCHAGTKNGRSISALLAANANFGNLAFVDSHGLAASGILDGRGGFHFPGRSYIAYSSSAHRQIGIDNSHNTGNNGPCVTCHKNTANGHTFKAGATVPVCATCHLSYTDTQKDQEKANFAGALEVLRAQLDAKGFAYYSTASQHFANTNWGTGQNGANTMGAAFNYSLLRSEGGAYAHNSSYAKQLLFDSIDYLDNGVIDDSVTTVALPALVSSGAISAATAQSVADYKQGGSSCTLCHGGTAASAAPMATNAHPTHLTGAYGPGSYLGSDINSCQTCHLYGTTTHLNGVVDLVNGSGSACAGCHPGTIPTWTSATRIACTSCHAPTPSTLPNGVAAPYKGFFAAAGHGRFPASNQCTTCHDANSPHISGSLGVNMRLLLANDNSQCASCHNDTTALRMSTHVLDKNATPTPGLCKSCHDPHGTSNVSMIRSTINGVAISFTNTSTGFVQLAPPYQGLCQVCHTLTSHYRGGQAPTDGHPTRNCIACHSHTASYAFKPAGACDSCHGYPPIPAGFVPVAGSYSSARVENYPNGGGAHAIAGHVKPKAKPSEGWANCAICHSNGTLSPSTHTMVLPVIQTKITIDVDDGYKFNNALPLDRSMYTGPLDGSGVTGRCMNTSCHLGPSKAWP